jgi:hypothetical protein
MPPRGVVKREENQFRLFLRKGSVKEPICRFKSVDSLGTRQSSQKVIRLKFIKHDHSQSNFQERQLTVKNPIGTHKQFRMKKIVTTRETSAEQVESPRAKALSL